MSFPNDYFLVTGLTDAKQYHIIYFNVGTKTAEVYEIKPYITYGSGKPYHDKGVDQMQDYVTALNNGILKNHWKAGAGTTLNQYFDRIIIPSELYGGRKLYTMYTRMA